MGGAYHLCQSSCCHNVACVDQTVKMPCAFLDVFTHFIVDFHVEDVGDQV